MADMLFLSVAEAGPVGGMMRTASTVRELGRRALMTAGEVPGGSLDIWIVGLGTGGSAGRRDALREMSSSSSEVENAAGIFERDGA